MLKTIKRKLDPEPDAVSLLTADHRAVEGLFQEFEQASNKRTQASIVKRICFELDAHTKVEEKILYPAIKKEVKDLQDLVNESFVEHAAVKRLVRELSSLPASDEFFKAKVTVMKEFVQHHVKEEESDLFPKIVESGLDLKELGERIARMKEKLGA